MAEALLDALVRDEPLIAQFRHWLIQPDSPERTMGITSALSGMSPAGIAYVRSQLDAVKEGTSHE